eukprot:2481034-Rhodomonas_salina.1
MLRPPHPILRDQVHFVRFVRRGEKLLNPRGAHRCTTTGRMGSGATFRDPLSASTGCSSAGCSGSFSAENPTVGSHTRLLCCYAPMPATFHDPLLARILCSALVLFCALRGQVLLVVVVVVVIEPMLLRELRCVPMQAWYWRCLCLYASPKGRSGFSMVLDCVGGDDYWDKSLSRSATSLRACYAMSGTVLARAMRCPGLSWRMVPPSYAYAVRCVVLTSRMERPGARVSGRRRRIRHP